MNWPRLARCGAAALLTVAALTVAGAAGGAGAPARARSGTEGARPAASFTTKLSGICPNPLIVQTNWLPEADHAPLYELIGAGGTMKQYSYEGPIGTTGIDLQIIAGGPGDAFQPTATTLYAGNSVLRVTPDLIMDSVDNAIQLSKKFPTVAVMNFQDHDPQVLIYNPAKFKSLTTIASLIAAAKKGAMFYVSGITYSYVQFLIDNGVPERSFIGGYSGDLEKFVTGNGLIVNQGYADSEPYLLAHETPAWGNKPIKEVFIYQLGLNDYPTAIQVPTDKLKSMSACLSRLVPMLQQAEVDYFADPTVVDNVLAKFNPKYGASYWSTPAAESDWAAKTMLSEDIVGNSDDGMGPLGGFDMPRLAKVITQLLPIYGKESPGTFMASVSATQIATNKFIDPSIKVK
jgi:hypothetical protein